MKKRTIKTICITAGAVVAVGAGIAVLACCTAKSKKAKKTVAAVPINESWNSK